MKIAVAALSLSLLAGAGAKDDRALEEILRLEDRRAPAQEFAPFLRHADAQVQQRAIAALGKIQERRSLPYLLPLLDHANAETRAAAVFAIGQIDDTTSSQALIAQLPKASELKISTALLEALGKVGDHQALPIVANYLRDASPVLRAESALAMARFAGRKIKVQRLTAMLAETLQDANAEVRWTSAYALIRCGDQSAVPSLVTALQDTSARVRMHAARALGTIADTSSIRHLSALAKHDPDWRVRVNAANALGNISTPEVFELLPMHDPSEHVRLAALAACGSSLQKQSGTVPRGEQARGVDVLKQMLRELQSPNQERHTWREYAAAALALAQGIRGEAVDILSPHVRSTQPLLRARLAQALAATQDHRAFPFLQHLAADSMLVVQLAAVEALQQLKDPRAAEIYLQALNRDDQVLTATAMQNLTADSLRRKQFLPQMIEAYRRLQPPIDAEVAQMIFQSLASCGDTTVVPLLDEAMRSPDRALAQAALAPLKSLTGRDYSDRLPDGVIPHTPWTWEAIQKLSGMKATIRTGRGAIDLEFFPEVAPLTVLNFVRLAEQDFYDGLFVHRVVPNFVIQAGDPRGDGWGSPGYSIRSEFNALRYTRGIVGMASAGPNTEGSQFFIVHSDQPHLNGRYTIFARVPRGMEVVDQLQVGDVIEDVVIH